MGFVFGFVLSLSAILVSIISFLYKKLNGNNGNNRRLPPGNMGLPWIGETLAFYKAQLKNQLFEDFIKPRITRHGTVFKTRLMGSPTVVVSGVSANRFFLSNEFKLVVSSWPSTAVQLMGKDSIMEKIGERHHSVRGMITEVLSPSGLEHLVPKICKTVEEHLKTNWQGQDRITLFSSAKMQTFSVVMECLLGIDVEPGMLDMFERVLEGVFKPLIDLPGFPFWRAKKARLEIVEMLLNVVRKKREEMERGLGEKEEGMLVTQLIKGLIRGEISEVEVIDNMVLLVFAAHDTTSFAIAMICRMLASHPNSYTLLLQEHVKIMESKRPGETLTLEDTRKMNYTWQVARESLRMFPPIFGSFRKAIVDIQYEGFTIPKGWKVLWTAYGTHYDKDYFANPLSFNPSRFEEPIPPYAFIPFGGGPRICAGYQLAKLNILVFLHYMVTRYDWSLIQPDEPITMDPLPVPLHGMPIKISPKF
ncbi:hypothetical protein NE237_033095 [Protea cynaroides]|uniref:Cytochrome P450 n=1 Tax=Protea cynaroides TaxID=273540 RepID=A0A9Q0R3Q1_9MAGN|nr:hypothetical protein NE237_033095 [Protea cynaroides]